MMITCKNITRYLPSMASLLLLYISLSTTIASAADSSADEMRQQSKPFYLRDIQIGDTTLPFSPVTVLVIIISFIMLTGIFNSPKSTASASHILLDDGNDAEKRLTKMRDEIKNDYNKFQVLARQHSKCPSGKAAGGRLGTFKPGMMVPAFDKVIFAKENNIGEVIGPIQTNFGWHLIWIEERNLVQ